MLRISLIALAFFSVTLVLILMQPGASRTPHQGAALPVAPAEAADQADVTRALTSLDTLPISASDPANNELHDMTYGVLDTLGAAPTANTAQTTTAPAIASTPQGGLELMVIKALKQGQSDTYIDALVNEAATTGTIKVPESLVTSDGRVDTTSLLLALTSPATNTQGPAGGQRYTVKSGDSLASISYRFFGTTNNATEIFLANRATLNSPSNITVGMELIIPDA